MRHTYPEFHAVESVETQVVGDPNLTGNPHPRFAEDDV
jgi:hypothetical protein